MGFIDSVAQRRWCNVLAESSLELSLIQSLVADLRIFLMELVIPDGEQVGRNRCSGAILLNIVLSCRLSTQYSRRLAGVHLET